MVLKYDKCTLTNSWVSNKRGILNSEWPNGIKVSMNSMSNRGTGGQNVNGSRHCRFKIFSENKIIKTPPQIRGDCRKTELLRNSSHHRVQSCFQKIV